MIEHARHVPLRSIRWSEGDAAAAIEDIVADGLEHFDDKEFWPAHPLDEGVRDGHTSLYFGATGMIWGIAYLGQAAPKAAIRSDCAFAASSEIDGRPRITMRATADISEPDTECVCCVGTALGRQNAEKFEDISCRTSTVAGFSDAFCLAADSRRADITSEC